jgi:hypothetical protein
VRTGLGLLCRAVGTWTQGTHQWGFPLTDALFD